MSPSKPGQPPAEKDGEEPSRADIERVCRFYGLAQSALEEVRDGMVEQLKE